MRLCIRNNAGGASCPAFVCLDPGDQIYAPIRIPSDYVLFCHDYLISPFFEALSLTHEADDVRDRGEPHILCGS